MLMPVARLAYLGSILLGLMPLASLAQPVPTLKPAHPVLDDADLIKRPPIRPSCRPAAATSLAVGLNPQQTSMWCWAASGQMVMAYLGVTVTQCTEANDRFGRSDCCNSPMPSACIIGGWSEFEKHGIIYALTNNAALSWADLRSQIAAHSLLNPCWGQPFAFSWHWVGGGGHMMVARGYKTVATTNYVQINDPWSPNVGNVRYVTYDAYVAVAGDHTHWNDYYHFVKH
jgi:Papain-like cysteine protease AvrRpt2